MSGICMCQWHDLPPELKIAVLRYLPFYSLMRFMLLSRESYLLALQAKITVFKVRYCERNQCHILSVAWAWHEKKNYSWYEVEILQNSAGGSVIIGSKGRRIYSEQDADSLGMQVLFNYTKLFDVQDVEIGKPVMSSGLHCMLHGQLNGSTLQAKRFTLSTYDSQLISSLIPFLPSHLSSIVICKLNDNCIAKTISSDVFEYEAIRTAREIELITESFSADLSDEQICNIKASTLCVSSAHITSRSINRMIHVSISCFGVDSLNQKAPFSVRQVTSYNIQMLVFEIRYAQISSQISLQWFKGEREINLIAINTSGDLSWSQLLNDIDPRRIQAGRAQGNHEVVAKVLHSDRGDIYIEVSGTYCELGHTAPSVRLSNSAKHLCK